MRRFVTYVFTLLLLSLAVSTYAETYPRENQPMWPFRETIIQAEIVGVQRSIFPYCRVTMNVTASSKRDVFGDKGLPELVVADNWLWTSMGQINLSDQRNIGGVGAFYLLQGDVIRAKLFTGSGLTPHWYVSAIDRIGPVKPKPALGSVKMFRNLELSLSTEREAYRYGEAVPITLMVRNTGDKPETLSFRSSKRYDIVVTQKGREVWRWSAGKMFAQSLGALSVKPGETLKYAETWRQVDNKGLKVTSGEYRITASLASQDSPTVGPVAVFIQPAKE